MFNDFDKVLALEKFDCSMYFVLSFETLFIDLSEISITRLESSFEMIVVSQLSILLRGSVRGDRKGTKGTIFFSSNMFSDSTTYTIVALAVLLFFFLSIREHNLKFKY